jgi:hypothetical protein
LDGEYGICEKEIALQALGCLISNVDNDLSADYPMIFMRVKDVVSTASTSHYNGYGRVEAHAADVLSRMLLRNATAIPLQDVRFESSRPLN